MITQRPVRSPHSDSPWRAFATLATLTWLVLVTTLMLVASDPFTITALAILVVVAGPLVVLAWWRAIQ